jgi:hypothetical protein
LHSIRFELRTVFYQLLRLVNVMATYHMVGVTHDSGYAMADWNADQVAGILRGERLPRLINPDAWERYGAAVRAGVRVSAGNVVDWKEQRTFARYSLCEHKHEEWRKCVIVLG